MGLVARALSPMPQRACEVLALGFHYGSYLLRAGLACAVSVGQLGSAAHWAVGALCLWTAGALPTTPRSSVLRSCIYCTVGRASRILAECVLVRVVFEVGVVHG